MNDFENYKIKMTLRSMCAFEQMVGRSFYTMGQEDEDYFKYMYTCLVCNNDDLLMDYSTFLVLIGDKKVAKWITKEFEKLKRYNEQFNALLEETDNKEEASGDTGTVMMTDVAASLIIQHKLDPGYVMDKLEIWEIKPLVQCAENVKHVEMVEKRFWTFLTIMPHIDGKKIKKPEQLVSFEWEKGENKKRAEEDLKNNMTGIKSLIGKKFDWIK